jgi:hypothetical protein
MKTHELKIMPKYFEAVADGKKTFEIRYNDRNYQADEMLRLSEHDGKNYTGRYIVAYVPYVIEDYCKEGYVTMSIEVREISKTYNGYYVPKKAVEG